MAKKFGTSYYDHLIEGDRLKGDRSRSTIVHTTLTLQFFYSKCCLKYLVFQHLVTTKSTDYATDLYKHHTKSSSYNTSRPQDYTKRYDYGRTSLNSSFTSDSQYGVRDYSKPFLPISSGEVRLGKRVVVMRSCGNVGRGVVRYVGTLPKRQGSYIGVELDNPGKLLV